MHTLLLSYLYIIRILDKTHQQTPTESGPIDTAYISTAAAMCSRFASSQYMHEHVREILPESFMQVSDKLGDYISNCDYLHPAPCLYQMYIPKILIN